MRRRLPPKLNIQNEKGIILCPAFSLAIHCKINLIENIICPKNPIITNIFQSKLFIIFLLLQCQIDNVIFFVSSILQQKHL